MDEEPVPGTVTPGRFDVTVGFDASQWTSEQLVAFVTRSPRQVALDHVAEGLGGLDLPSGVADAVLAVVTSTAAHHDGTRGGSASARVAPKEAIGDEAVLAAAHGARVVAGFADGVLVDAARTLADRAGAELLARRRVSDPGQLSATARRKWRTQTKSVVAQELAVLTGHGIQAAHAIVGFALAPPAAVGAATQALRAGATDWRAVSAFWSRCATFETTAAGQVDQAVFAPLLTHPTPEDHGDNPDPETDDTGADGTGADGTEAAHDVRRESWAEFHRRLEREAVRAESADDAAARAHRRAAHARRDVHARVGDHGTGEILLTGSTTSVAGAVERIESIARAAKAAGDPRTLGQIRSDTAFALLIHGILPLPGTCTGTCPTTVGATGSATTGNTSGTADPVSTAGSTGTAGSAGTTGATGSAAGSAFTADPLVPYPADLARILSGMPATHVEVIVPASFLTPDPDDHHDPVEHEHPVEHEYPDDDHDPGEDPGDADRPPARSQRTRHRQRSARRRPGGVAEIIGYGFLSGEHARELVLTPGTTLHRLLTDPADGRLLERSTTAYRPDAAMITQLRAADVFCRAPGCQVPARRCDIDHEREHDDGGPTAEPNLGHKHRPHHQVKTARFWATIMNATRHVTWRTLFGRMYTTSAHDYTQYEPPLGHAPADTGGPGDRSPQDSRPQDSRPDRWVDPGTITDPDTRNQLIYAALSTRAGMDQWLQSIDDDHDTWTHGHNRPLSLFHHVNGRRRPGPPPVAPDPDQLINPTPPVAPDPNTDPPPF